ncbi:hypothetical protein CYMTET_56845 [Cymbomonas tetramitiformis]|uniref:Large ribosomal subunit protein uL29m n=1 Tax=Cymbomonas tetramitiformis TaxID=36881 RepID=A0AAE0ELJ8_9CHLO|nr:hypothetical protein CYMTET_56845 [Cymbomonas tetramitiformis]
MQKALGICQSVFRHVSAPSLIGTRQIATTRPNYGIEEFFRQPAAAEGGQKFGVAWSATVLRTKSFDDLHKLWYVMLKEQNALYTEMYHCRKERKVVPEPRRMYMVKSTMARIKRELTERAIAEADGDATKLKAMKRLINGPKFGRNL